MIKSGEKYIKETVSRLTADYLAKGYLLSLSDSSRGDLVRVEFDTEKEDTQLWIVAKKKSILNTGIKYMRYVKKISIAVQIVTNRQDVQTVEESNIYEVKRPEGKKLYFETQEEVDDILKVIAEREENRVSRKRRIKNINQDNVKKLVVGKTGFGSKKLKKDSLCVYRLTGIKSNNNGYIIKNKETQAEKYVTF